MNVFTLPTKIRKYFDLENYEKAIATLEDYINNYPENQSLSCYLGLAYFLSGNESQGTEIWFSILLEEEENIINELVEILATEAKYQLQKRQFSMAQKLYQEVIELDQNNANFYFNLGEALVQQSFFDEAITSWQEALKLQPDLVKAYQNQASVRQKLAEYSQAIIAYQKVLEITPNDVDSLYNLGLCYGEINELETSIKCFQNCLEINQEFSQAYGEIGYILLQQKKIEEAIYYWQKLVNFHAKFSQDYGNWTDKLIQENNTTNPQILANNIFLKALHLNESLGKISFDLGNLLVIRGNYYLGIQCYKKALEYNDKSVTIYENLIIRLIEVKQMEEAEVYLKKLEEINDEKSQELTKKINTTKESLIKTQFLELNTVNSPQGFYETALEWALNFNLEKTNYFSIYPENIINLYPPNTTDKYIHYSFRFGEKITLPNSFVVEIPEGRFWLKKDESISAVITQDNKIIGDLSPESPALSPNHPDKHPSKHSIFTYSYLPPIEYINGTVVILAGVLNNIYFHWLFDILPRINLLKSSQASWENIDYFVINNTYQFQKETLTKLGIAENKIINPENGIHIQAKKLIIPSFPGTIAWMPKWACEFLRNNFVDKTYWEKKPTKRIYIKRNQSSNRRLINEEEIIEFLKKFDFEAINLELLSVYQQANLLAQAKVVISPHGSGLSNLVFCQKGTKIVEIFSPFYVYPCYWLVSNLVELEYYYIIGETLGSYNFHKLLYSDSRSEDIYLNCQSLQEIMKLAQINRK